MEIASVSKDSSYLLRSTFQNWHHVKLFEETQQIFSQNSSTSNSTHASLHASVCFFLETEKKKTIHPIVILEGPSRNHGRMYGTRIFFKR